MTTTTMAPDKRMKFKLLIGVHEDTRCFATEEEALEYALPKSRVRQIDPVIYRKHGKEESSKEQWQVTTMYQRGDIVVACDDLAKMHNTSISVKFVRVYKEAADEADEASRRAAILAGLDTDGLELLTLRQLYAVAADEEIDVGGDADTREKAMAAIRDARK